MSTCETCKHRGDDPIVKTNYEDWTDKPTTYFECKRAAHDEEWKYEPGQRALVIDGSGYRARLCVELTFGCNQWEQSDAAEGRDK